MYDESILNIPLKDLDTPTNEPEFVLVVEVDNTGCYAYKCTRNLLNRIVDRPFDAICLNLDGKKPMFPANFHNLCPKVRLSNEDRKKFL